MEKKTYRRGEVDLEIRRERAVPAAVHIHFSPNTEESV